MAFFTILATLVPKIVKGISTVAKGIKSSGVLTKSTGMLNTGANVAVLGGAAASAIKAMGASKSQTVGTLPLPAANSMGNLPGLPALGNVSAGGGLPMPMASNALIMNDPRLPEYLKQFALAPSYLRSYIRAPKGYVIIRDANGQAFAINKVIARHFGLWKPNPRPPISAGDWKNYKKAQSIEKKLRKIAGPALRKHSRPPSVATKKRK